ncbi:MAG: HXXEE domain-containing protein [Chitinophagaceae bacterium]
MVSAATKNLFIVTLIAIIAISIFYIIHPAIRIFFIPAMIIAYIFYIIKSHNKENKHPNFTCYLLCIAIQLLHFTEEFIFGFNKRLPELMLGIPPQHPNLFVSFNMVAYSLFVLGAIGIYKKIKFMMIIVWFFAIAGVVFNVIGHMLYAIRVEGYFPGLYASFMYWIAGPILLSRMLAVKQ